MAESPPQLDEPALERLYLSLEKSLYNVVYRWLWSSDEARDVVQEAFMKLWAMRARVRLESVEPLVYRIALNLAASRRRWRRRWRWLSLDGLRERRAPASSSPELNASRSEIGERLRRALVALPEELRRVVVMCELSELSYEQIAGVLGIPAGTVGSRRHRALKLLRRSLGEAEAP